MAEDFKLILVYISVDLIEFIKNSLKKTAVFFISLLIIIPSFFFGLKSKLNYSLIIILALIFIIITHLIKEKLFIKSQFIMNYKFLKHIFGHEKKALPTFSKKEYMKKRKDIRGKKIWVTKRITMAFYVLSFYKDIKPKQNIKKELIKIYFFAYSIFSVLIAFFELISLALAFGNGISSEFIIFLSIIGFIFAYAVFTITFDPIIYLLIQRKIIED